MNKYETYFGQVITDSELNEIFDSFANAIEQFVLDFGYCGIAAGAVVTQHTPLNLSVDVSGSSVIYDQAGNRTTFASPILVNCALDENGVNTAVVGTGNEKWLSIFLRFIRVETDPRTDDLGAIVYFRKLPDFEIHVVQGPESPTGTSVPSPMRGDSILLADVKLIYGQVSITNASISTVRTQTIYDLVGTPLSIKAKGLADVLQQMLTAVNNANTIASNVTIDTLQVPLLAGSPVALGPGTLHAVLIAFLASFNSRIGALEGAGPVDLSGYAPLAGAEFTGPVSFPMFSSPGTAMIQTSITPADIGSEWLLIGSFKYSGGSYVRMYVGTNASNLAGSFAIVNNCLWDGSNWQRITANNDGHNIAAAPQPSSALIWNHGRIRVAVQPKTESTWAEWPLWPPTAPAPYPVSDTIGLGVTGDIVASGQIHGDSLLIDHVATFNGGVIINGSGGAPSQLNADDILARRLIVEAADGLTTVGHLATLSPGDAWIDGALNARHIRKIPTLQSCRIWAAGIDGHNADPTPGGSAQGFTIRPSALLEWVYIQLVLPTQMTILGKLKFQFGQWDASLISTWDVYEIPELDWGASGMTAFSTPIHRGALIGPAVSNNVAGALTTYNVGTIDLTAVPYNPTSLYTLRWKPQHANDQMSQLYMEDWTDGADL